MAGRDELLEQEDKECEASTRKIDFVEAILFTAEQGIMMTGRMVDTTPSRISCRSHDSTARGTNDSTATPHKPLKPMKKSLPAPSHI